MNTQKHIQEAEACFALLDSLEKVKASTYFETRQLAYMEAKMQAKNSLFNWQTILKPAFFIVFLIGINITTIYSYLHRVNVYANTRNTALITLSDNYIRSNDYYSLTNN